MRHGSILLIAAVLLTSPAIGHHAFGAVVPEAVHFFPAYNSDMIGEVTHGGPSLRLAQVQSWQVPWKKSQGQARDDGAAGASAYPDLSVTSLLFTEPSGNNMLDAEEQGVVALKARNNGKSEARDVRLLLDTVDRAGRSRSVAGVVFERELALGTLGPGEERFLRIPVAASANVRSQEVLLRTVLHEEGGFDSPPAAVSFRTAMLAPPALVVSAIEIFDADGRRVITKGKEITVVLTVRNAGGGQARGVACRIESKKKTVAVLGEEKAPLGSIDPGESKKAAFSLNVTRRYDGPKLLPVSFAIDEERARFSVKPRISLVLNKEAPMMPVVKVEPKLPVRPQATRSADGFNIDTLPALRKEQKVFGPLDVAVVVGIEQYHRGLPRSEYSYNDARLIKAYLEALGFAPRNIEFLKDDEATRTDIQKSLERKLPNMVKSQSRVFFYYSGHGAPDPSTGTAYLLPYDGDPSYLQETGYPLARLYEMLGKLHARETMVVLDACFTGAGGRSVMAKGTRPLVMMAEAAPLPPRLAVLSATTGSQISASADEREHGILTYYFLRAIREGRKSMGEIYEYVRPLVQDEAKRQNVDQTPALLPSVEHVKGRFIIAR